MNKHNKRPSRIWRKAKKKPVNDIRDWEAAQIYCAMCLHVPQAGYNAKPEHVDQYRAKTGVTVAEMQDIIEGYIEGGCGIVG
jgi:hypothetical protein